MDHSRPRWPRPWPEIRSTALPPVVSCCPPLPPIASRCPPLPPVALVGLVLSPKSVGPALPPVASRCPLVGHVATPARAGNVSATTTHARRLCRAGDTTCAIAWSGWRCNIVQRGGGGERGGGRGRERGKLLSRREDMRGLKPRSIYALSTHKRSADFIHSVSEWCPGVWRVVVGGWVGG